MIRVLVSGAGKMGRTIVDALFDEGEIEAVGVVDGLRSESSFSGPAGAALPLFADAAKALDATTPDVVVDFTNAVWTPALTEAALPRGVRPVIGTTGLAPAFIETLARDCRARGLGGVVAPNFTLGGVLMMHMARLAAKRFESAEIIELHHDQKADAPSGTSLATARGMIEARGGRPFARNEPTATPIAGTRAGDLSGVTIHSVRLPGLVAHQEVIFGGRGETLTIRHDSTRESYIAGVTLAIREVMTLDHLVIGLESLLGLD